MVVALIANEADGQKWELMRYCTYALLSKAFNSIVGNVLCVYQKLNKVSKLCKERERKGINKRRRERSRLRERRGDRE